MKLFRVKVRGMPGSQYSVAYVVESDAGSAYAALRKYLDKHDIGFRDDRELYSIELIAEDATYPACKTHLHLPG